MRHFTCKIKIIILYSELLHRCNFLRQQNYNSRQTAGTFWLALLLSSRKRFKEWRRKHCCFLFSLTSCCGFFSPPGLYFICFHALPLLYSLFKFYNTQYILTSIYIFWKKFNWGRETTSLTISIIRKNT